MEGIRTLVALAALLACGSASAQVGVSLAARVGTSIPYGDAFRTSTGTPVPVAAATTASIPLQLDAGITLHRQVFLGAYGSYRFGLPKSGACAEGLSCSDTGARLGAELIYTFGNSRSGAAAWVGIGTGWEWWTSKGFLTGTQATVTLSGWEIAQLQVGADMWLTNAFRMGFYLSGSLAQYSQVSAPVNEAIA